MMVGDGMMENKPVREWHKKAVYDLIDAILHGKPGEPTAGQMCQIVANAEPDLKLIAPDPRLERLEALVKGQHHTPQKFECPHYCMICQVESILHPKEST